MTPFRLTPAHQPEKPFVFASPHSGRHYPPGFRARSRLDEQTLRRSEDAYVDQLLDDVAKSGASLIAAQYARAYLDLNREAYELDPLLFEGPLPPHVNCESERVSAGLGTIARVVATGVPIYSEPLSFEEAEERIETIYRPYHRTLETLMQDARARFGHAVLIDCHSMPSNLGARVATPGMLGDTVPDIVLGDRFGRSCSRGLIECAERILRQAGYRVTRNQPYAGGYCTSHYGRPTVGFHALQIEINRALYMDENSLEKASGFVRLKKDLTALAESLVEVEIGGSGRMAAE